MCDKKGKNFYPREESSPGKEEALPGALTVKAMCSSGWVPLPAIVESTCPRRFISSGKANRKP